MNNSKLFMLLPFVFLFGCQADIETEVKISDLLSAKTKDISGDLYLEVSSCNSYEDSRKDSSAVTQAKETIPQIFSGAKYVECFRKQFKSYANFSLPMKLDKDNDDKLASNEVINLISHDRALLSLGIPSTITQKIEAYKERSFSSGDFDLSVNINVVNDTGSKHPFKVISAYIDDEPYVYGSLSIQADSSFNVKLSNVSVDRAKTTDVVPILFP